MDIKEKIKEILENHSRNQGGWNVISMHLFPKIALEICQLFPKAADNPEGYEQKPELDALPQYAKEAGYGTASELLTDEGKDGN